MVIEILEEAIAFTGEDVQGSAGQGYLHVGLGMKCERDLTYTLT